MTSRGIAYPTHHYVLDIETTDLRDTAAIFSIGCVNIERTLSVNYEPVQFRVGEKKLFSLSIPEMLSRGCTISDVTIEFWKTVDSMARDQFVQSNECTTNINASVYGQLIAHLIGTEENQMNSPILWCKNPWYVETVLRKNMHLIPELNTEHNQFGQRALRRLFANIRDAEFPGKLTEYGYPLTYSEIPHLATADAIALAKNLIEANTHLPHNMSLFY